MSDPTLKRAHEKFVCDELLKALNLDAQFVRMGNDSAEPDALYRVEEKTLGIEIGTAYYDNSDARLEWTIARGERAFPEEGFEFRDRGVIHNPDNLICEKVQHEIDDKCSKRYAGTDEIWLCIEQRAALSDAESVAACIERLKIPGGHHFARIYIFYLAPHHDGGEYRVVQIA
jgi:hypothetical protein